MTNQVRNGILFVCESIGSLNIASRIVRNYNFRCPVYLFVIEKLLENNQEIIENFGFYTTDPHTLPGLMQKIKLVLLGAHESSPHCRISNAIGFLAKQTGTAHASLQHGWIQPGLNFWTNIKNIDYRGFNTDNSRSLFHFSKILKFFGATGIGYPQPLNKPPIASGTIEKIIIATNFNWGVYHQQEIKTFIESTHSVRSNFPNSLIVHRPHPAEKNPQIQDAWDETYKNCKIQSIAECEDSRDLLWPSLVISTPSTIALDYICLGIPTILYAPEKFQRHINDFSLEGISYNNPIELQALLDRIPDIRRAAIPKFPTDIFEHTLLELYRENQQYNLSEDTFFTYCERIK